MYFASIYANSSPGTISLISRKVPTARMSFVSMVHMATLSIMLSSAWTFSLTKLPKACNKRFWHPAWEIS